MGAEVSSYDTRLGTSAPPAMPSVLINHIRGRGFLPHSVSYDGSSNKGIKRKRADFCHFSDFCLYPDRFNNANSCNRPRSFSTGSETASEASSSPMSSSTTTNSSRPFEKAVVGVPIPNSNGGRRNMRRVEEEEEEDFRAAQQRRRKSSAPNRYYFFDYSMIPDKDPRSVTRP